MKKYHKLLIPQWKNMSTAMEAHFWLSAFWALLLIPTLIWWKESILWVATMSLYANFVGHVSSYQAAAAAGVDMATRNKLDAIALALADILDSDKGDPLIIAKLRAAAKAKE